MIENGYCFDQACKLGHPRICRDIFDTGRCKRYICRHFHPINLRNANLNNQPNRKHDHQEIYERPNNNRRHYKPYLNNEITNTRSRNVYDQWEQKREHGIHFFRGSKQRLDRSNGTINGESNGGTRREDVGQISTRNQSGPIPWKITYQNIRRIVTKNNKEKVLFLNDYTKQDKILIMNFTETWLNETIQDDVKIEGYNLHRGDRKGRDGGGTAIYIREEYETRKISELSVDGVEMVAVYLEKLDILNIVIYRPPDARLSNFSEILRNVRGILKDVKISEPTIVVTGDFNFPFAKWKRMKNGGCIWKEKNGSRCNKGGKNSI